MPTSAPARRSSPRRTAERVHEPDTLVSKIARNAGRSSACSVSTPREMPALAITTSGQPKRAMKSAAACASVAASRTSPRRSPPAPAASVAASGRVRGRDARTARPSPRRRVAPRERFADSAGRAGEEDLSARGRGSALEPDPHHPKPCRSGEHAQRERGRALRSRSPLRTLGARLRDQRVDRRRHRAVRADLVGWSETCRRR